MTLTRSDYAVIRGIARANGLRYALTQVGAEERDLLQTLNKQPEDMLAWRAKLARTGHSTHDCLTLGTTDDLYRRWDNRRRARQQGATA